MMNLYIRARYAISSLPNAAVVLIGAAMGGLVIYLGGSFHIGSWFMNGSSAYVPAIATGAATALLMRYLLRRA
jgi:hypothetical protein